MLHLRFTIAKNVAANLVRGCATAAVALALPHFLVKKLSGDRFAAWSLLLQIAAYAGYLDFGLQTAVARFLARYTELHDYERRDSLISTAFVFLGTAAVLGSAGFGVLIWQLPDIFRSIPPTLVPELRWATAIVALGSLLLLPVSTFSGVLIGLHRNEWVALAVGGSRLVSAAAVLISARYSSSLIVLALCFTGAGALGALVQVLAAKRSLPALTITHRLVEKSMAVELAAFCGGLTLWSISMFLVTGLDLTIVGAVDFRAVGYYSVAATLVAVFAGANTAVCAALMTPVAALHAAGQKKRIRDLILSISRINTFANLTLAVGILVAVSPLLKAWVGLEYSVPAMPIARILIVANGVRLAGNPYAMMLIATGQQRFGIAQGAVEGITNIVASVTGALLFGPVGVAWGTLIGAICGLAWACCLTAGTATEVPLGRRALAMEALLRPLGCAVPLLLLAITFRFWTNPGYLALMVLGCGGLTGCLAVRFGRLTPATGTPARSLVSG